MKQQRMASSKDRISGLPNNILCHILSFSDDTGEVVRTCLVSKRWRYVWTSVPTITISDWHFYGPNYSPELNVRFMDFIDSVLCLNVVSCLRKFRLDCIEYYYDEDAARVSEWINAVAARDAEDIELGFNMDPEVELPPSFFTCNKVMVLKLIYGINLNIPSPAKLCNLKILSLDRVGINNEVSMKNLLEGCPVLEELVMNRCYYDNMITLFVKSSSLKRLEINYIDVLLAVGLVVDATSLESLKLTCDVAEECVLNNSLSTLVEVRLDFFCDASKLDSDVWGNKIVELLRKISNTVCMFLPKNTMQYLEHARLDNLPMFYHLTRMELEISEHGWQVLPYLIECAPILLSLALTFSSLNGHGDLYHHFRKPNCLTLMLLQHIELRNFRGCRDGMELVSYLLENSKSLKKMLIGCYYSGPKHVEILEKLLTFPRSSSACQITIT